MKRLLICALGLGLAGAIILAGCSGGSSTSSTAGASTVAVTLSDPTTCGTGSLGSVTFTSVFVTVTDVQINASATAGDNDANWIDLTPNLKNSPQTIDLMSKASAQCFLATLGTTTNLPPGTYQQVRVMLASSGSNSSCGSAGPNCVVPTGGTPQPLLLSSQAQTGLKIPSGQIAGGQFMVAAGDSKTLNIDIDGCASIVMQGNGQFRLKPVLHAGEVNTTSSAIDGTLVDKATGKPILNAQGIVLLEQATGTPAIDRKVMEATVDPNTGRFSFCPVSAGTYDVVAVVVSGSTLTGDSYPAAIITGVKPGQGLGTIQLTKVSGTPATQGTMAGTVSTSKTPPAVVEEDVTLSALAGAGSGTYTIPLLPPSAAVAAATASVHTTSGASCAANTDCVSYKLYVPGAAPTLAAFTNGSPVSFTSGGTTPGSYKVEADAGTSCSAAMTSAAISVSPGAPSTPNPVPELALTGCQ